MKELTAALTDEIAALGNGIKQLDKDVAEATETRKEEHEDFVEGMAANSAAKDILGIAKNRLNKFYNPKLYKPPPKRELTEAERITVNNGGTLAPTAAPGGIAGTGVAVFLQVPAPMEEKEMILGGCKGTRWGCCPGTDAAASGPNGEGCDATIVPMEEKAIIVGGCAGTRWGCCPGTDGPASGPNGEGCEESQPDAPARAPMPETWEGDYQKKGQANNGVMAMIGELEAELDKEIQEGTVDEKNAQAEYEEFVADSAVKRAEDSKSIEDKAAAKAQAEVDLQKMKEELKMTMTEAMTKAESLKDLHLACDWILSNYATRKEARTGEVEALKKAKAVLAGADFSLLQIVDKRLRGRSL